MVPEERPGPPAAGPLPPPSPRFRRWKRRFNIVFFFGVLGYTAYVLFGDESARQIPRVLRDADPLWLAGCVGIFLGSLFFDSLATRAVLRCLGYPYGLLRSIRTTLVGHFYGSVTPMATGGQPMEVYYLVQRDGIPLPAASSALLNKSVLYECSMVVYVVLALLFGLHDLLVYIRPALLFTVFGITLTLAATTSILLLYRRPDWIRRIARRILGLADRIVPGRDPVCRRRKVEAQLEDYTRAIGALRGERGLLVRVTLLSVGRLTTFFLTGYFVYRALGFDALSPVQIVVMQALLHLTVSYIPTPGNMGVYEYGFYLFYRQIYPPAVLFTALLLWRTVTYYGKLAGTGLVVLFSTLRFRFSGPTGPPPASPYTCPPGENM